MKLKKIVSSLCALGLGAGLALSAATASAAPTWYLPFTLFEDDNLDYVFDNDQSGTISVGDRFFSVLEFNSTSGVFAGQGPNAISPSELTAVADVTIVGISGSNYIYAPSGASGSLAGFSPGTMIAVYLDGTPDLNVINGACGTRAQCAALAGLGLTDGSSLYLTAGFFGDPDELWIANAQNGGANIATVQIGNAATKFGTVNFSLSVDVNNTGYALDLQACAPFCAPGGDGFVRVVGSADILGGQGLNASQWTARSDTDAQLAPIPEPASLALVGLALAGLGVIRRRAVK